MINVQRAIVSLLTVNAVLLTAILWVLVADRPLLAETAAAQNRPPNAGAQRDQMIVQLDQIRKTSLEMKTYLERGRVHVVVVPPAPKPGSPGSGQPRGAGR